MSNLDLEKWQKAIQSVEAGQKDLSLDELSAFRALKELAGNGKFEANESNTFIKVIKDALPSHSNHRLLQKVHLPNFIKLCEKYFKVKVAALVDVLKTNVQGSALTFEPPVIQQPTIEPPIFEPPTVQPANQENADTTETQQEKQEQKIEPTKQKGSNTQLVLIIIAVALLIGGWQVYQNWNILFGKPEEISIDKTSLFFENISASEQLTATVLPDDIPRKNRKVSWHSNDTLVAIVNENGIVTAIASGNAVITAYTVNELSASCSVTVEIVTDSIEVELEQLADENELLIPLEAGKMQTEQTKNPTQQNQQISKEQQPTPSAKNNTDNTIASTIAEPLNQSNQSNQSQSQPVQPTQPAQPQYVENIHIIDGAYSGFVLNGKRQGNGVFMWDNGDKYEGNYENGVMSGYGKLHSPGRMFRYEGNFANGSFHGQGVYHNDRDGWRHEGAFFRGKPHGAGIRYYGKDMSRTLRGIWENGEFKTATR